jgi:hypothetical protein
LPIRPRRSTVLISAALAVSASVLLPGQALAESYGYIRWTNNCSHAEFLSVSFSGGTRNGHSVVTIPSVPAGAVRSVRVESGYRYNVNARQKWTVVSVMNVPGRVHTVVLRAC